jgi:hypothetical protein
MRLLLALSAVVLLAVGLAACGTASKGSPSTTQSSDASTSGGTSTTASSGAVPPGGYRRDDGDKDNDDSAHPDPREGDDQALLAEYGNEASGADKRAVAAVIKSYYAAAAGGEGAKACSLLYSSLAAGLAVAPGQVAGQTTHGGGKTCAAAVSALFKLQHAQLVADDVATMMVLDLHVKGNLGLAVLGFRAVPRGEILVEREGGVWKVDALFNSEMT